MSAGTRHYSLIEPLDNHKRKLASSTIPILLFLVLKGPLGMYNWSMTQQLIRDHLTICYEII